MDKNNKKSIVKNVLEIYLVGCKTFTDEFPIWMRPVVRIPIYCLLVIVLVITLPFAATFRLFSRRTIAPFTKLKTRLDTRWHDGDHDGALHELRRVKETVDGNMEKVLFKGVSIEPYGKFKFDDYFSILWLLYHWEFQTNHFQEAAKICEYIIGTLDQKDYREVSSNSYWKEWVLNKARAIHQMDGINATQEFLLQYVDPENKEDLINRFLYDLRERSK